MPDIATIAAITTSVKTAMDIAKAIKDADVSLEKAELKLRIAELISALADTKIASAEILDVLQQKDAEIEDLRNKLAFKEKLVRVGEASFQLDESGKPSGDPFSSNCWETKALPVHLKTATSDGFLKECPSCGVQHESHHVKLNIDKG